MNPFGNARAPSLRLLRSGFLLPVVGPFQHGQQAAAIRRIVQQVLETLLTDQRVEESLVSESGLKEQFTFGGRQGTRGIGP
jgi:hypothetical protein